LVPARRAALRSDAEHFFAALLDEAVATAENLLDFFNVDTARLRKVSGRHSSRSLGHTGKPTFSPRLLEWINPRGCIVQWSSGQTEIRPVDWPRPGRSPGRVLPNDFVDVLNPLSAERNSARSRRRRRRFRAKARPRVSDSSGVPPPMRRRGHTALRRFRAGRFTIDFTRSARAGRSIRLRPDREIRQIIDIWAGAARTTRFLVGEAGVGKTGSSKAWPCASSKATARTC